jgi:ATP-dependent DNA helicase 2 subunit 2
VPRVKQVRPYKSYDGFLTLGGGGGGGGSSSDGAAAATLPAVAIQVERYFKTHRATPASATTATVRDDGEEGGEAEGASANKAGGDDDMDGVEFAAVRQSRTYKVDDASAPGGKRDVDFESLAKGYEYGRTAVHISESEHNITKLETTRGFEIIGFVHKAKVGGMYGSSPLGDVLFP